MGAFDVLLVISLMSYATLAENTDQNPSAIPVPYRLNAARFKRQQGTLQQQLNSLQNPQQQNQLNQQNGQQFTNNWQTSGNNGNNPSQTSNNQGSTTTDAEIQRVNDCIQRNCRQGVQLASICGTDNVSYKNRPYFNCVRDCGRRIDIQHVGDCYTTRGAPTALSTG